MKARDEWRVNGQVGDRRERTRKSVAVNMMVKEGLGLVVAVRAGSSGRRSSCGRCEKSRTGRGSTSHF